MSTSNNEQDMKTFFPDGIAVKIAGETFAIKPFVLRNRIKVVKVIAEVFATMATKGLISTDTNAVLVAFINVAGEKMIDIYEIVLGKDRDWLEENVQLADELEIIKAVTEVNRFPFLLGQIQGMLKTVPKTP